MKMIPLEVYAEDSNYAVVKPPGRNYPGCAIQGDSLRILCDLATGLAHRLRGRPECQELADDAEELASLLVGRLLHYQDVLRHHQVGLPYGTPLDQTDLDRLLPPDESEPGMTDLTHP